MPLVPMVIERTARGEREFDIFSRLLNERIIFLGSAVDDQVGDFVVDGAAEEDDPLIEKPGVDVERALAARGLLDHHGNQGHLDPPRAWPQWGGRRWCN